MSVIKTKTTYLEMHRPPTLVVLPPREDVEVTKAHHPRVEFYRHLYQSVGGDYHWIDRLVLSDEELRAIIHDDKVDIFVLAVAGETAGFAELDCRTEHEIELRYFGLFPAFIGQGLGKHFLNWTVRRAWATRPKRVWLHTCDLDHPAALPNYLQAGFEVYDEEFADQAVPDDLA